MSLSTLVLQSGVETFSRVGSALASLPASLFSKIGGNTAVYRYSQGSGSANDVSVSFSRTDPKQNEKSPGGVTQLRRNVKVVIPVTIDDERTTSTFTGSFATDSRLSDADVMEHAHLSIQSMTGGGSVEFLTNGSVE